MEVEKEITFDIYPDDLGKTIYNAEILLKETFTSNYPEFIIYISETQGDKDLENIIGFPHLFL